MAIGKDRVLETLRGTQTIKTWRLAETKSAMNELRTLVGQKFDVEVTIISSMEAVAIG